MILRAAAAIALTLILAAATPRPVIVVSDPGPVHPVDEQRWRTGAPPGIEQASLPTPPRKRPAGAVVQSGAPPHLIPPACSGPCPTPGHYVAVDEMSGYATWYDDGLGLYGAVHSWRYGSKPYRVMVCALRCVAVTIRDYCRGCGTGIDLSPSAFRRLGYPLSRGRVLVRISR
jgi:hypothetical protein